MPLFIIGRGPLCGVLILAEIVRETVIVVDPFVYALP